MEKIINASEARKRFAEISDEVRTKGVTYIVRKHGRETMRLMPPSETQVQEIDPNLEQDIDEFFQQYKGVLEELAKR